MADICDRSPCDRLLEALGNYIFGILDQDKTKFTLEVITKEGARTAIIEYCPFCGTRLEEIGPNLLHKFLPRTVHKISKKALAK